MTQKERLEKLLSGLPLDRAQRAAAEEGIASMDEDKAREIADDLNQALDDLPAALDKLEAVLEAVPLDQIVSKLRG